ncbi:glycine oxidase ThiO [Paenibacillus thalictri]|uniref:glycine oxidase n=1 Tax=Paenibacillus thalictri TaxID=2527873 RepID=A0A4Q9DYG8_9BACL|nr:glycine oxidase ThiO [Paenibacillus thalictri]TBL81150.1 glycine oxidase ThiO [Paenibacillus thalictri]
MNRPTSAVIIGGGIIGGSIALELAKQHIRVTLLDKGEFAKEASTAAAGMIGAQVEIHQPGPFYELCKASQRLYEQWTRELHELSGVSPQYINKGIVRVALNDEDEAELKSRLPWIDGKWITAAQAKSLEPGITGQVRGGVHFAQDHQIHPLHLARALRGALSRLGVSIREWTPALRLIVDNGRVTGVRTTDGDLYADEVVLAAGAWSPALLEPLPVHLPVFPVRGQCISVRMQAPAISATVFTKGCYIVPKLDGTLTIGATQEEAGFVKKPTVAVISELHAKACQLVPALSEAEFVATWTGLRPGTPDGLPYMGRLAEAPGLTIATGHFRNGILLAPVTGLLMQELVTGQTPSLDLAPYAPSRASGVSVN